jgi:ABC-2 type transport system permease protein
MKKAWLIAQKDLTIRFRDGWGLLFLLVTPLILTTIMGFAFGGGEEENPVLRIPVAVVNQDAGLTADELGEMAATRFGLPAGLITSGIFSGVTNTTDAGFPAEGLNVGRILVEQVFGAQQMQELLASKLITDEAEVAAAHTAVAAGRDYCCVVTLPSTLTRALFTGASVTIPLYSDPAQSTSAQIVESVVRQVVSGFASGGDLFTAGFAQLQATNRLEQLRSLEDFQRLMEETRTQLEQEVQADGDSGGVLGSSLLRLETLSASGEAVTLNALAFFVPAIAMIFLGFGASQGVRSLIAEEEMGTLGRLNAGPLAGATILTGKLLGAFLMALLQFGVLLLAGALIFQVYWGDPLGVVVLALVVVLAFTGLGLLIAVIGKDQAQANTLATLVALVFSLIGGNLLPARQFPAWLQQLAQITPNYWGMEGFVKLSLAQPLRNLTNEISVLAIMSLVLFGVGVLLYQRRLGE